MAYDPYNDPNAPGQVFGFRIDKATWGGNVLASPSYGDPEVKKLLFGGMKVGSAFAKALDPIVLKIAIHKHLPKELAGAAYGIAETFKLVVKVTAGALCIGVAAGGIIGVLCPPVGLAMLRGAQIGLTVATRLGPLILSRLGVALAVVGSVHAFREAGERFQTGIQLALNDDPEFADIAIAEGYAIIICFVLVGIITAVVLHGVSRLRVFSVAPSLSAWVKGLPQPVEDLARASKIVGKTEGELKFMMQESRGKMIVERGGNPERLNWKGRKDIVPKGMHIKSHTLPSGMKNAGAVGWDMNDSHSMADFKNFKEGLAEHYSMIKEMPRAGAVAEYRIVAKHAPAPHIPKPGNLEVVQKESLHNYIVRQVSDREMVLLDPQGKFIVGDIDRLATFKLGKWGFHPPGAGVGVKGYYPNDSVAEVNAKNAAYRAGVPESERVGDTPVLHGESWRLGVVTLDSMGEPHFKALYPKQGPNGAYIVNDEPILIALDGKLYILKNWHHFKDFCLANGQHGLHFPWTKIVTASHKV